MGGGDRGWVNSLYVLYMDRGRVQAGLLLGICPAARDRHAISTISPAKRLTMADELRASAINRPKGAIKITCRNYPLTKGILQSDWSVGIIIFLIVPNTLVMMYS